jgi:hypothetical protein
MDGFLLLNQLIQQTISTSILSAFSLKKQVFLWDFTPIDV